LEKNFHMRKGQLIERGSSCPLCRSSSSFVVGTKDRHNRPLTNLLCVGCGLYRVDPLPEEDVLREYYRKQYRLDYKGVLRPRPHHVIRAGRTARDRIHWLLPYLPETRDRSAVDSHSQPGPSARIPRSGRWLDVGAGSGEFAFLVRRKGLDVIALEPNHGYGEYVRRSLKVTVFCGFLEDLPHAEGPFDGISCFHMLEHHPSPIDALMRMSSHLHQGGLLALEVPNAAFALTHPSSRFHPAHLVHFTLSTLEMAARAAGFVPLELRTSADGGILWAVLVKTQDRTPVPVPLPVLPGAGNARLRAESRRSPVRYYGNPRIWLRTFRRVKALLAERWEAQAFLSPESYLAGLDLPE
jgi:2-polyprenyl-3-methyl-5-hydroxy-6-metoxy-1,4-benzoquinol methylase